MTQTNTTQNKEELNKEVKKFRERYEDFIGIKKGEHIFKIHSDYFDSIAPFWLEELSQAHQSGIEEVVDKIKTIATVVENTAFEYETDYTKGQEDLMDMIFKSLKENKQ